VELSKFLTSFRVKIFTTSFFPKLQNYKTIVVVTTTPMVQQQQQLMLRLVVKAIAVNGIFYMDLGACKANGNANEMEIQKWHIKVKTSKLNAIVIPYDHH